MSKRIKIFGIDPGAKRCGYSVISCDLNFNNPEYVKSGIFGLSRNDEDLETYSGYKKRLIANAIDNFQDLLDEFEPDLAVFEFLPVSNIGAAAGQRLLAFSVATVGQAMCNLNAVPWNEITASTVKKEITGSGVATKVQVRNAVLSVFPQLKEKKYLADETDAIAVVLSWMKKSNTES
jgi:crossover junction endodeoxyribonuclease RuvC